WYFSPSSQTSATPRPISWTSHSSLLLGVLPGSLAAGFSGSPACFSLFSWKTTGSPTKSIPTSPDSRFPVAFLQDLAQFMGYSFRVSFAYAVRFQMSQLMGDPMSEPFLSQIPVVIHKKGSARQMRKHRTTQVFRDVQLKYASVVEILPVRNKDHPGRKHF